MNNFFSMAPYSGISGFQKSLYSQAQIEYIKFQCFQTKILEESIKINLLSEDMKSD